MIDMELHKAQQQLADAERQHAERVRNEKIAELERLRGRQFEAQEEFGKLEGALRSEDEQRIRGKRELQNARLALGSHEMMKPALQNLWG